MEGVPDVSMVEPGYLVPGLIMEELYKDPPSSGAIIIDSSDEIWKKVHRFFEDRAAVVISAFV